MARAESLRSKEAQHKSFVRFFNNTQRKVNVVWINYEGHHVKYRTLSPGNFMDVNTFATHPWLFIDSETNDRLVVKSEEVFMPDPWFTQYRPLAQDHLAQQHIERTNVYITIPLFSLRQRAMQVIRSRLSHPKDAYKLEIPGNLQQELAMLIKETNGTPFGILSS